jgi:hypothetical protein
LRCAWAREVEGADAIINLAGRSGLIARSDIAGIVDILCRRRAAIESAGPRLARGPACFD